MSQISNTSIADLYLSGMNIAEVSEALGIGEWAIKKTIRELGIMRSRSESIALAKRHNKRVLGHLDKLEQKEAAPCFRAHQLFSIQNKQHKPVNALR
ncbi:RWP-RK domain-containing protein [Shewanella colwelliana]|uniref:hypothetical protein n=1 Tax=Shewanella colwelliana TaxID=23 RepID=UPI0037355213